MVGATQLLHALLDHGDEAVKKLLVDNPDTYIRILNVVCRLPTQAFATTNTACWKKARLIKPNQGKSS